MPNVIIVRRDVDGIHILQDNSVIEDMTPDEAERVAFALCDAAKVGVTAFRREVPIE